MKTVDELIKTCRSLWHQCLSEPAAAVGLLCDTVWQRSDTAANLCCWYLVTPREERTVFASGFYSRSDFPGLRVHPQRDVKLTLRIRQWRDCVCVCVHVANTQWHYLLARDDNKCLRILQMRLQLLANNKGIHEFHCWWLGNMDSPRAGSLCSFPVSSRVTAWWDCLPQSRWAVRVIYHMALSRSKEDDFPKQLFPDSNFANPPCPRRLYYLGKVRELWGKERSAQFPDWGQPPEMRRPCVFARSWSWNPQE